MSDINDKNPEFVGEPYNWTVKEGLIGAHVGVVQATDADDGINANITYSVPDEVPFTINPQTGTIMTSTSLDYEKQKVNHSNKIFTEQLNNTKSYRNGNPQKFNN